MTINPGRVPDQDYVGVADRIVVFENTYSVYASASFPSWIYSYPPGKFVHLVYDTPSNLMSNAVLLSRQRNAGYVYFTDDRVVNPAVDSPWDTLPSYLQAEYNALCHTVTERVKNGGFETYASASKIPSNWVATNFAATDGKDTNVHRAGAASVKIIGAAGKTKRLTQTINLSGNSGDKIVFSFWVRGKSFPAAGLCRGEVLFYNGATLTQTKAINCATATTAFQKKSLTFTVNAAYTKIVIRFTYSKASGTVWFDGVSLMR